MKRTNILWALGLGLLLSLANATTALAQECGGQTCVFLPAVLDMEGSAPSLPAQLARAVAQAPTDAARLDALADVMQTLRIGIYTADGMELGRGAERAPGDFYLYDFELDVLAASLAQGETWSLAEITQLLEQMGIFAEGVDLSPSEVHEVLREGMRSAHKYPSDPLSFIPLLVRELGLLQPSPYDLAADVPVESLRFDALQRWLIVADILLPVIWDKGPVADVSAAGMHLTAASRCADIGSVAQEGWSAGKWLLGLYSKAKLVTGPAVVGIDGLHGMLLAYSVEVRALEHRLKTHYGHETPGQEIHFRISVRMRDKLPDIVVECGWLLGVVFPHQGPIPGVTVVWTQAEGNLNQHGEFACGSPCTTKTDAQGIASVVFKPKPETQPGVGMVVEEAGLVDSLVLYQSAHKNALGAIAQILIPKTYSIRWFVEYHQQDTWQGHVTIRQSGQETATPVQPGYTGGITKRASYEATFKVTGAENHGPWGGMFLADLTQSGQATIQGTLRKEIYGTCTSGEEPFLKALFEDSVDGSYSGTAHGEARIQVSVDSDGTYELFMGYLRLEAPGSRTAHNVFWDVCQPAYNYDRTTVYPDPLFLSPSPVRVIGQVNPSRPDRFVGSYTTSVVGLWNLPTTVTVEWDLFKQ